MSSTIHSIPKTNIANTVVSYFNSFNSVLAINPANQFVACLYTSAANPGASIERVEHEIAYDCILRNGEVDIEANTLTAPASFIIALDGVIPPLPADQCRIDVPVGASGVGTLTTGDTFVKIPKGVKVSWRISPLIGGQIIILSHLAIEVHGSSSL